MPYRAFNLLLVEPQALLRSTVVAVAREIQLARIEEASSVEAAARQLARTHYQGLLLSLEEQAPALALLQRLRRGELVSPPETPVVAMAAACSAPLAQTLKEQGVQRVLVKPFKVRTLLESVQALRDSAAV